MDVYSFLYIMTLVLAINLSRVLGRSLNLFYKLLSLHL